MGILNKLSSVYGLTMETNHSASTTLKLREKDKRVLDQLKLWKHTNKQNTI